MYKYTKKTSSVLFSIALLLGIILFSVVGTTFAYFQVNKQISANLIMGKVSAGWYLGNTLQENNSTITLSPAETPIVRGDANGVAISGGTLQVGANGETENMFVRIKYSAYPEEEKDLSTKTDLSEYFSFRISYLDGEETLYTTLGDDESVWANAYADEVDSEWYYFIGDTYIGEGYKVAVCNNIYLSEQLPQDYMGMNIILEFKYEVMQVENMTYDAVTAEWGEVAAKLLIGV